MADDKKKKDDEKKGGKGSKIIIILLIAVIVVLVAAGALYFFVFSKKPGNTANTTANVNTNQVQQTSNGMVTTVDVDEQTYSFEDITTNLADKDPQKFIKVTVALGYDPNTNKKLKAELENKEAIKTPILQAEIVGILRSKTSADLADQKKVEQIKNEILGKVNMHLKSGKISNVYFSNLVIQ